MAKITIKMYNDLVLNLIKQNVFIQMFWATATTGM